LLLEIIQDAINEAFEFDGDPVENLIAAAFDNRLLREAIGNPIKEACAAIIRQVRPDMADDAMRASRDEMNELMRRLDDCLQRTNGDGVLYRNLEGELFCVTRAAFIPTFGLVLEGCQFDPKTGS
jgi:hypothetical protein